LKEKRTLHYMSIKEIKSRLSILTVLAHYDLQLDRNNMLKCPFHEDAKASMRVYPQTNTAYCFAGSCKVDNLDVIDFVMQMDNSTKHAAIKKCEQLLSDQGELPKVQRKAKPAPQPVAHAFNAHLKSFAAHKKAREYAQGRALDCQALEIGYKSQKAKDHWARGCIIFPLKNALGEVVSLYGRSIYAQAHFYQAARCGLYPAYPPLDTEVVLLSESIIDAATLQCLDLPVTVLALYGTNGLTAEHLALLGSLPRLEEIILALDGDEAGRAASVVIAQRLSELPVGPVLSALRLPQGEDVNSLAVAHDDPQALFAQLLTDRQAVIFEEATKEPVKLPTLDTTNPYDLCFSTNLATYRVKGGLQGALKNLDSLKVTLAIEHDGRTSRRRVNLYEDRELASCARAVGERLGLRPDLLEIDLSQLTNLLEDHREELRGQEQRQSSKKVGVPAGMRDQCLQFWKGKSLLKRINELIGKAGIVGEDRNRLLLFIVASSFKMPVTLHALIQGASGSGKTRLLRIISELMPEESIKRYTRVTDGSFYNQGEYFFTNKLLCFEDIDGLKEDALLAVRELQSNEILITSTSFKDDNGGIRGGERIVRGPIASISCTTRAEVYEDNISRCFVVAVDESREQSLRVIQYQNDKSAGVIETRQEKETRLFLQNCIRTLQPLEVVNPYANQIHLPKDAHKIRRLNELYQSFVRQITLLHQYQRKRDGQGRLISTVEDLKAACEILFESIVLKVDELDGSLRQFFEQLKTYVKSKGEEYEFNRFEVRKATGVSKTQQHRYLNQLIELEYLRQFGFANRGYRYKIAHWDDMGALRAQLKSHLNQQLSAMKV
ncbi:MAG: CHC2 zinc finger domain-containing protein, partial [Bacteroidota bacterium]